MIYFQCDYAEGCHPRIMDLLQKTNLEQSVGYGLDPYCQSAREKIRAACGREDAQVHFLVGGTQTNMTFIAAALRPHQGVLTADTGHIACHETGAVEATGHKAIALPSVNGKITAGQVLAACREHWDSETHEHMVQPGMVYLSFPTESGTLYSKAELTQISQACRQFGLPLFLDGARLGYGLTSPENDLTLPDIAALCDAFYIGGTKCGALMGEALVILNPAIGRDFRYAIKQRGGMLAKGRLLGIQFEALFTDDLYWRICRQANQRALEIRRAFAQKGIPLWNDSPTNQQFVELTAAQIQALGRDFVFETWGPGRDGRTVVRFCTSWATPQSSVDALTAAVAAL
ncbi:MAG TPA: low specificity L-threonine aldolase [Candidatus Excrementavichristensenella intestinipullorum]|nr:low specificity L-threonine aldolase [Candidatus Excrementavichristensenella intestinipullorum]